MGKSKLISSKEAAKLIFDGAILGVGGFIGIGVAEEIHQEVEKRFLETGKPENLTLLYAAGIGEVEED